ncbi:4-hydroxyproline epimerase [Neisseria leonii]|uniref:4-hydroxyproline epimerase n=1 Tax=Neisseria leonii TaxID=2995413 RepID=UPI00237AB3BC|nr:4-hydroxyproline epimerase [Neisseria sp. 3986]MDD9326290.1 4-hydroxyproline epimerase [Neisseria sp. 3986]
MADGYVFSVIDSHTGGEPTRVVYGGFPELDGGSVKAQCADFAARFDHLRRALILEPRGSDVLVGALLCRPQSAAAAAGVIFFNNSGYLGMCGHGTIGLVKTLHHLGRIGTGTHLLETPVGDVCCTLHEDGSVSVRNVPAYRYRRAVPLDVAGVGRITGDIAWGGNWFFLTDNHGCTVASDNLARLTDAAARIRAALNEQGIRGKDGAEIDHIELFGPTDTADSRSFVLCPGGAYDRSPCGTGTSAKLACLAADGVWPPEKAWIQESVIGSRFAASYEPLSDGLIVPTITGRAHIHAAADIFVRPDDPFACGIETS